MTHPEFEVQRAVVELLRLSRVPFVVSLSGVHLTATQARLAKAQGMSAGDPDLLIIRRPPRVLQCHAMALELKREDLRPKRLGGMGGVTVAQWERHETYRSEGWHVAVAWGVDHAIEELRRAGYVP